MSPLIESLLYKRLTCLAPTHAPLLREVPGLVIWTKGDMRKTFLEDLKNITSEMITPCDNCVGGKKSCDTLEFQERVQKILKRLADPLYRENEKGTCTEGKKASVGSVLVSSSPSESDDNEVAACLSSSPDYLKKAAPTEQYFDHLSSESLVQLKMENVLSNLNPRERSRILIQGVYMKTEMKTTFEEILTTKPNFLSGLRLKGAVKTALVESAIQSLQNLRQCTAGNISLEQLAYIKDCLDNLEICGLDIAWLERGYQRASLLIEEQKVVSAAESELARLEKEKILYEAKLEASTACRDAFKAEYDAWKGDLDARKKKLFGCGLLD